RNDGVHQQGWACPRVRPSGRKSWNWARRQLPPARPVWRASDQAWPRRPPFPGAPASPFLATDSMSGLVSTEAFLFLLFVIHILGHSPVTGESVRMLRPREPGSPAFDAGEPGARARLLLRPSASPRAWRRRLEFLRCESLSMLLVASSWGRHRL